jgi:hypothetical protein
MSEALATPVAIFLYNRPAETRRLLDSIRRASPRRLYVIADGPRDDRQDQQRCRDVRELVEQAELATEVRLDFATVNMGNRARLLSGIDRVFEREAEAIFVEDDCRLSDGFFSFCATLLERYRDDARIMMISGTNPLGRWRSTEVDYFFSKLGNAHAWAGWRRGWALLDRGAVSWGEATTRQALHDFIDDQDQFEERCRRYDLAHRGAASTWDYEWALTRQSHGAFAIVPAVNLARHEGRGPDATHVKRETVLDWIAEPGEQPLLQRLPPAVEADADFDRIVFDATHNRLTAVSAVFLAGRLLETGQRLRAAALLKQLARRAPLDPQGEVLLRRSLSSSRGSGDI